MVDLADRKQSGFNCLKVIQQSFVLASNVHVSPMYIESANPSCKHVKKKITWQPPEGKCHVLCRDCKKCGRYLKENHSLHWGLLRV